MTVRSNPEPLYPLSNFTCVYTLVSRRRRCLHIERVACTKGHVSQFIMHSFFFLQGLQGFRSEPVLIAGTRRGAGIFFRWCLILLKLSYRLPYKCWMHIKNIAGMSFIQIIDFKINSIFEFIWSHQAGLRDESNGLYCRSALCARKIFISQLFYWCGRTE